MPISTDTPFQFDADAPLWSDMDKLSATHAIGVYRDSGNSGRPTAVVITSAGVAGASVEIQGDDNMKKPMVIALSSTKALACWTTSANVARARVLSISGTTVTPSGSTKTLSFSISSGGYASMTGLSSSTALLAYTISSQQNAVVLSVFASLVSEGSILLDWAPGATVTIDMCTLSTTKALAVYLDPINSNRGTATILNVSGTTVTDGGSDVVFETDQIGGPSVKELTSSSALVTYKDTGDQKGKAQIITVSGSVPSGNAISIFAHGTLGGERLIGVVVFEVTRGGVFYQADGGGGSVTELLISGTTVIPGNTSSFSPGSTISAVAAAAYDSEKSTCIWAQGIANGLAVIATVTSFSGYDLVLGGGQP
jgi:hypothetical protein